MTDKNEFRKVSGIAHKNNKLEEFNDIMDDYFEELAKYHPKIYVNLMKELHKLGAQTNIESQEELDKYIKHIHHKGMPTLWTLDQTTSVAESINIDFDEWRFNPYTFNFVMNMVRADNYAELKEMFATSPLMKQSILDNPAFYAHLAKAWLNDEDAPADKAIWYIKFVSGEIKDCTTEVNDEIL